MASVYRAYDCNGALLYIGASTNVDLRMASHKASSNGRWYRQMARLDVRSYPDIETALFVEARAISMLRPRWNLVITRKPKAKPIKALETWRRWVREGCPGADD